MRMGYQWRDGGDVGDPELPYENLNIVLKGTNTIESSTRTALELYNGLKANIIGTGTLTVKTNNTMDHYYDAFRIKDETQLTVGENAQVLVVVAGEADDFLTPLRGCETGELILKDSAKLKTTVLSDAYYDHRGLERFASITVQDKAELETQGLYLNAAWEMGTENAAKFIQTGGTVTIDGHMRTNRGHNYTPGILGSVGSVISITGGTTIINLKPEGNGEFSAENFSGTGISTEGGTIEIGKSANITINNWHNGDTVCINGWGEQNGVFKMTGGALTANANGDGHSRALNIDWGTDAQITGGTLNLNGEGVNICSDLTISGTSVVNASGLINIDNGVNVTLDGAELNLTREHSTDEMTGNVYSPGAMDLHPGSTFNLKSGSMTAVNGAFYIGGEFVLDDGTLTIQDGEFYADNVLNVNGGTLKMQQLENLYHSNTFENRPFQSELGVNGVLNLNGGNIVLDNVYMNVNSCLNLNGGHMTIDADTFNSEERAANQYDDDWMVAARVQDMAQMNVNAGTFTMNGANFETILEVYGEYKQTGGAVTVKDLAPENVRTDNSTFVDHADNTLVLAKGGKISGGSLTTEGGLNGILVHFSYEDDRTHEDGSSLMISGDANVVINAIETGINMERPVVISGGKVNIDIESILYEDEKYRQYVQAGYGILATGQDINSSLTISGGTVNINVPTAFDESKATKAFDKIPDLLGIFSWRNSVNISGGVTHITAMDSLVTRNDRFQDILNIVGMNVIDNADGSVLQEVYGSREIEDRRTMYFRTFESDNEFGSDGFFDAADSITIASASCGNGTYWTYDGQTKTLKIYGNGEMKNFTSPSAVPWNALTNYIKHVEIADSVTAIGSYAFAGCSGVQEISLSKAITSIGEGTFEGTSGLTVKVFHNTVAEEYVKNHNLNLAYRHTIEDLELVDGSDSLQKCKYQDCDYVQVGQVSEETPVEEILDTLTQTLTLDDTAVLKEQLEAEMLLPSVENIPTAELIEKLDQKLQDETDLEVVVTDDTNVLKEVLDAPEGAKPAITGAAMNADSDTTVVSLIIDVADVTADKLEENLENVKPVTVFNMTLQKTQLEGEIEALEELKIPVTITIPIPTKIKGDNLKVLHYADGTDKNPEIITPSITVDEQGNRYATFIVTGFSTYALATAPEITIDIIDQKVYLGEELPDLNYQLKKNGEDLTEEEEKALKDELKVKLVTTVLANDPNTYVVRVQSYNTSSFYSLTNADETGVIEFVKKPVTVTANSIEVQQYDPMHDFTFTAVDAKNNNVAIDPADVTFQVLDQNGKEVTNVTLGKATQLAPGTYIIQATVKLENYPDYEITTQNGTLTVKESAYVCWNPNTEECFTDLSDALEENDDIATETIKLIKNCEEKYVVVAPGTTLDLNGYTVTASYVFGVNGSHVTDNTRKGLLKVDSNKITLAINNKETPLRIENEGGYRFGSYYTVDNESGLGLSTTAEGVVNYNFVTKQSGAIKSYFTDNGASDNEIKVLVRISWLDEDGNYEERNYSYNDGLIQQVAKGGKKYTCKITGLSGMSNVTICAMVVTDYCLVQNSTAVHTINFD